jgi:hypothetical protein
VYLHKFQQLRPSVPRNSFVMSNLKYKSSEHGLLLIGEKKSL